ncbi:MAG: sulfatase [Caulobacterales bacterium]|nr:sulfatase [Caulobacterales bacterium]
MPMSRRQFALSTAAAVTVYGNGVMAQQVKRPNVVFVLSDDWRWDAMSAAGSKIIKTPNIDRIANEGARFANAFCTTSLCSPSRASFLSGMYPHIHGVVDNFTDYPIDKYPSYHASLSQAGYATAYIGKWHMGEGDDSHRKPFDYWASHKGQGQYYDTEFHVSERVAPGSTETKGERKVIKGYYTHVVTQLALDWIKRAPRPFSLQLGHKAPHGKWYPEPKYEHAFDNLDIKKPPLDQLVNEGTPDWVKKRVATWHGIDGPLYEMKDFADFIRGYYGTILSVDDSIGALYAALQEMGELDNTIFVVAGDNGFLLGEHASIDKRTAWEESIRIPMLVRYPPAIAKGTVVDELVMNMDLAPTVLDLTNVKPPAAAPKMQGLSTKPLFGKTKPKDWRKSVYYQYNFEKEFPYTPNVRAVRTDEWIYMHYPNGGSAPDTEKAELYNIKTDSREMNNLIDKPQYAAKQRELKAELLRLQTVTGALPDKMPQSPALSFAMPDAAIR